jgi:ketosteroid isomerase-like protein
MKPAIIEDIINKAYAAFNRRDIDTVLALMHPDVHWPNGWEGGFVEGHSGVRDYWTRQWAELDPEVVPLSIIQLKDGRVEVEVRQTVKDLKGNLVMQGVVKHLYTMADGLINSMEIMDAH